MVTILCRKDGLWMKELEEELSKNPMGHVTLLALGKVKMEVLEYLNKRNDLLVIKLETRYMKNKRKGVGLKIQVIKKDPKTNE